jgi:VanZ family protein
VAVSAAVIALESTESFGSDHTSGPLRALFSALFGDVSDARWEIVHHHIRKSGHFLGYGCIGLFWLRAWWKSLPRTRFFQDVLLALAGTALIAGADEWHQTFLPNRTGTPVDVVLDCSGALALQLLVFLFLRLFQPRKLTHEA